MPVTHAVLSIAGPCGLSVRNMLTWVARTLHPRIDPAAVSDSTKHAPADRRLPRGLPAAFIEIRPSAAPAQDPSTSGLPALPLYVGRYPMLGSGFADRPLLVVCGPTSIG